MNQYGKRLSMAAIRHNEPMVCPLIDDGGVGDDDVIDDNSDVGENDNDNDDGDYVDDDDNDKPCIHADTLLISYNNSEPFLARSLKCGDLLLGPDGRPREVKEISKFKKGLGQLENRAFD